MQRTKLILCLILPLCTLLAGCLRKEANQYQVFETVAFDTTVTVKICKQEGKDYTELLQQISDRILELEKLASLYLEDSEISQLNLTGSLVNPSAEFLELLHFAKQAGDDTNGFFDVSIQPIWEFYQGESEHETIEQVLALVDYRKIQIESDSVSLASGMKLSFNGFIQGYLTDSIYTLLSEANVQGALVNGGEYRALGQDFGEPWIVSIQTHSGVSVEMTLADSQSLAVSAGYGYIFDQQSGGAQSHLFDPSNQRKTDIQKTYVVTATTAAEADVWATVIAVTPRSSWPQEAGRELFVFPAE